MFTEDDFSIMIEEADNIFSNMPQQSRFSFIWFKAHVTPGGKTYGNGPIYSAVPGFITPPIDDMRLSTPEGAVVKKSMIGIAIPKQYGETIVINGITYVGGIQVFDRMDTQDGTRYEIIGKHRRGFGAYYVLEVIPWQGLDPSWIGGQFPQ